MYGYAGIRCIYIKLCITVEPFSRRQADRQSLCQLVSFMSYRVERLAAGGPLRRVGDTLRSSASEPAGHPAGDAVPSVLLQHLRARQKNAPVLQ